MKGAWVSNFFNAIEKHTGLPWQEALMTHIDFNYKAGFSEYETLGTFLTYHYYDRMTFLNTAPWHRNGKLLIGAHDNCDTPLGQSLIAPYHFMAFEVWGKPCQQLPMPKRYFARLYFFSYAIIRLVKRMIGRLLSQQK